LLIVVLNTINQNTLISHSLLFPSFFNKISFSFIQCFQYNLMITTVYMCWSDCK
jgi:hypothetical protein